MGALICENLACVRGTFRLRVDALRLEEGEKVALLGENGCGKSTLLQILAGLLPHAGGISRAGARWDRLHPEQRAASLAYLPQTAAVLFNLSVAELIDLTLPGQDLLAGGERRAVIAATETGPLLHRNYHELSGGEQRRAMLARTLCRDSALILLDEPTAPLDLRHAAQCMRHLAARKATVIAALHDINLALRYFDRFLLMRNGSIVCDKPNNALTAEDLEAAYGIGLTRCGDHFLPDR